MRLICPECGAQYEIAADMVPAEGREVECSACAHVWHQSGIHLLTPGRGATDATPDAPDDLDDMPPPPKPRVSDAVLEILRAERAHEQAARQNEDPPRDLAVKDWPHSTPPRHHPEQPPVTQRPAASKPVTSPPPQNRTEVTIWSSDVAGDSIADMDWPATTVTDPQPETASEPTEASPPAGTGDDTGATATTPSGATPAPAPKTPPETPQVMRHSMAERREEPRLAPIPRRQRDILDDPQAKRPGAVPTRRRPPLELPDAEKLAATLNAPEPAKPEAAKPGPGTPEMAQPETGTVTPPHPVAPGPAIMPLPRKPDPASQAPTSHIPDAAAPQSPTGMASAPADNTRYHMGMTTALVMAFVLLASYALAPLAGPDTALANWYATINEWRAALFDNASAAIDAIIGR